MKACVIKFFKKVWAILMHIFCFVESKHKHQHEDEAKEQSDE